MSRTPDAHDGLMYESETIYFSDTEVSDEEGEIRYTGSRFSMCDAVGEFDPRPNPLASVSPENVTKSAAVVGTASALARVDLKHDVTTATPGNIGEGQSASEGSAVSLARSDHVHGSPSSFTPDVHKWTHISGGSDEVAHQDLSGAGSNTHAQIDTHIASTSDPHNLTAAQVSLDNVTNYSQLKRGAADFYSFTLKDPPVDADIILVEDSADSWAKKKVQLGNIPGGSSEAIGLGNHAGASPFEVWWIAGNIRNYLASVATTVATNYLTAIPFISPVRGRTVDRLGVDVEYAYGGYVRIGIYTNESSSKAYPYSLLVDSGQIDLGYAGVQSATISQVLSPGTIYWMVTFFASPTSSYIYVLNPFSILPILGTSPVSGRHYVGYNGPYTYGALPASFPTSSIYMYGTNYDITPAVGMRFSA